MKALVIYKDGITKVEDVPTPEVTADTIRIKVKACGVCGSDIPRVLNNKAHYYPIILGHEFSGIVDGIGKSVDNVKVGDHVVGVPLIPCHDCEDCKNGNYSLCKNYRFIGSRLNGAMAEYVVVPRENVVKLNNSLAFEAAAFIEPLTVVLHGLKQNDHKTGKKVAILGFGTIGCLAAQVVKAYGAENITVIVRHKKYNELIHKIGIKNILNTSEDNWLDLANAFTNGRGYDFIYETAGAIQTMHQAFQLAGNKSHLCFIGTPKKELTFTVKEWELMNRKEFYLTGSWMSYSGVFPGTEWKEAVRLLENGDVIVYPEMIHKRRELVETSSLFDDYKATGSISGRNLIVMD